LPIPGHAVSTDALSVDGDLNLASKESFLDHWDMIVFIYLLYKLVGTFVTPWAVGIMLKIFTRSVRCSHLTFITVALRSLAIHVVGNEQMCVCTQLQPAANKIF